MVLNPAPVRTPSPERHPSPVRRPSPAPPAADADEEINLNEAEGSNGAGAPPQQPQPRLRHPSAVSSETMERAKWEFLRALAGQSIALAGQEERVEFVRLLVFCMDGCSIPSDFLVYIAGLVLAKEPFHFHPGPGYGSDVWTVQQFIITVSAIVNTAVADIRAAHGDLWRRHIEAAVVKCASIGSLGIYPCSYMALE